MKQKMLINYLKYSHRNIVKYSLIKAIQRLFIAKLIFFLLPLTIINAESSHISLSKRNIVVTNFEIMGDLGGIQFKVPHQKRIQMASDKVREKLQNTNLYKVVDNKIASVVIKKISEGQYVTLCNGCELDIAKKLGAEYILLPWVYRVSNLILTMHFEIKEVATGKTVIRKVLDFRGDNDKAWLRAINHFIRFLNENEDKLKK